MKKFIFTVVATLSVAAAQPALATSPAEIFIDIITEPTPIEIGPGEWGMHGNGEMGWGTDTPFFDMGTGVGHGGGTGGSGKNPFERIGVEFPL